MDNRKRRRTLKDLTVKEPVARSKPNIGIFKVGSDTGIWYLTSMTCIPEYYGILFNDRVPAPILSIIGSNSASFYRMKYPQHELNLREAFLMSWNSSDTQGYIDTLWNIMESSPGTLDTKEYMKMMTYLSIIGEAQDSTMVDMSEITLDSDVPIAQQLEDNVNALTLAFSTNGTQAIDADEALKLLEANIIEPTTLG